MAVHLSAARRSATDTDTTNGDGRYLMSRLRWADSEDLDTLCAFYRQQRPQEPNGRAAMADWTEHGGALLLEDDDGSVLAALRWREAADGWQVDEVARREGARGKGYGRWLMTKVEALAIRSNVANLMIVLSPGDDLGYNRSYYRRLGYLPVAQPSDEAQTGSEDVLAGDDGGGTHLRKRVGGKWQVQEGRP